MWKDKRGVILIVLMLILNHGAVMAELCDGMEMMFLAFASQSGDDAKAFSIVSKCAEKGDGEAQMVLGTMYSLGQGTPRDYEKANYWFRTSASKGVASAYANLAAAYLNGRVQHKLSSSWRIFTPMVLVAFKTMFRP